MATVPASEATRDLAHVVWPWALCPASPRSRCGHPLASPLKAWKSLLLGTWPSSSPSPIGPPNRVQRTSPLPTLGHARGGPGS